MRENQTIIQCDVWDHLPAWNIYRRPAPKNGQAGIPRMTPKPTLKIAIFWIAWKPDVGCGRLPAPGAAPMSECRVLCLKSALRLERRGEQGQEEA